MLSFEEKFNLVDLTQSHVTKMMNQYHETLSLQNNVILKDVKNFCYTKPKIVGHEPNNILLLTWSCSAHPIRKSFLGIFDLNFNESKLICTHLTLVDINNATINQERSLVAFCLKEIEEQNDENSDQDICSYKSYIAEILPQNHVFFLNIVSPTYQKLKFLKHHSPQSKRCNLVFMHHKESIGLYHIPLALVDSRYVMSDQPVTQQIVRKFLWCQYDEQSQRLFYVVLHPLDEEEIDALALFTVVEFKPDGDFQYILNFPLPISFKMSSFETNGNTYNDLLSNVVSSSSFNMIVLASKPNTFYVCYQHPVKFKAISDVTTPDSISACSDNFSGVKILEEDFCSVVSYTICCIHSTYKVQCTSSIQRSLTDNMAPEEFHLLFTLFNDYLMVYLKNTFLHLLDIGSEHEPVHSLLIKREEFIPNVPSETHFSLFNNHLSRSNNSRLIYDNFSQTAYEVKLNQKNVFRYFLSGNASTRLSILHACMIHLNDKRLTKKIMERIFQDSSNIETLDLLKEYLLAASYVQMRRLVAYPADLKVFPFTSQELYRGQVERNMDGIRTVFLFYKTFHENINKQIQKVLCKYPSKYWENLYSLLSFEIENRNKRFPIKAFHSANSQINSFSSISVKKTDGPASSTVTSSSIDENEAHYIRITNNIVTETLVNYLMNVYGNELKSKATNLCREYAATQNKVISTLWKTVLKSLGFSRNTSSLSSKSLEVEPDSYEITLFQILERLNLLVDELCHPPFPGMKSLFVVLGVRCLSREQFIQHLEAGVFEMSTELALRIIKEISDVKIDWKIRCLYYLPKETVFQLLREWEHPIARRYIAQHYLAKVPSQPTFPSSNVLEFQENVDSFIPIETLLEAVKMNRQSTNGLLRKATDVDDATRALISKSVLQYTQQLRN